jgi:HEAT repeat protein/predicted MFS family arabinose efflux permease
MWYVVATVVLFALSRAVAITALFPWSQEYVPTSVRGKYSAISLIFWSVGSFLAVTLGGYVLGSAPDLSDFTVLFAVGVFFGLISLGAAAFIPGGSPVQNGKAARPSHRDLAGVVRDKNFVRHLSGVGLTMLAVSALVSFLPLFLSEEVGLDSGAVVLLQAGTLLGGLLASYVWGWAADRYGSKPIMASGAYLLALQPLFWWLVPRSSAPQTGLSFYFALAVAAFQGMATLGWQIGSARLLFVNLVPPENKTSYLALYYAWIGVVQGLGQLIAGRLLDLFSGISGQFFVFTLDPYSILFAAACVLPLLNALLLRGVTEDSTVGVAEFAGFFLRGHPFRAAESLIRYHWARDERATVSVTERLGEAKSPLTAEELLELLADPRFFVRFEAIVSIARGGGNPRLTEALVEVLRSEGPALGVIAAWALGRIGDQQALIPLREGLDAPYRSIQAHCARSLGSLGDTKIVPTLLERLRIEEDRSLKIAFASALGALGAEQATADLLDLLYNSQDENARMELALSLARIVGNEQHFVQLWRHMRTEPGTSGSQVVALVKRRIGRATSDPTLLAAIDDTAEALARDDPDRGAASLSVTILRLPTDMLDENLARILYACAERLGELGASRMEYLLLALHAMYVGWH